MKNAAVCALVALLTFSCASVDGGNAEKRARQEYYDANYAVAKDGGTTIGFGEKVFSLCRSAFDDDVLLLEFVPTGESIEKHGQMITVIGIPSSVGFDDYLASYLRTITPFLEGEPQVYVNERTEYEREMIVDALLVDEAGDRVEHVLAKIFMDAKGRIVVIVLSTPFSYGAVAADPGILARDVAPRRAEWIERLALLYFLPFE